MRTDAETKLSCDADDQLALLGARMIDIRPRFLDYLGSLPEPFGGIIKEHYCERLVRAGDRHMLGEYSPFFLSDLLNLPTEAASCVSLEWLVLYEHALLVDDCIDKQGRSQVWLLCSQVLYDKFITLWLPAFQRHPGLWARVCEYHVQAIGATLRELQCPEGDALLNRTDKFGESVQAGIGLKCALVKSCALLLTLSGMGRNVTVEEERSIDSLCLGVQVLDDLTDCIEDYKDGRESYVVKFGAESLGPVWFRDRIFSDDAVIGVVMLSGAFCRAARFAASCILEGLSAFRLSRGTVTYTYLLELSEKCLTAADRVETLLSGDVRVAEALRDALKTGEQAFANVAGDEVCGPTWAEVRHIFIDGPSAAN